MNQLTLGPGIRLRILFSSMCMFATLLGGYSYAQDSVNDDEIYQLDPFTISEEATEGYIASNSLAGTRTNTEIKDIPVNIQVFTKDFAEDFLITNQVELERYNAALVNGGADVASSNTIQQAFNQFFFRGFQQNWGMRDGVRQYDPIDTQGLARVEVVKGPAAALYGLAYPGGLMNSISKSVDFYNNFTDMYATIASEGEYRATIDTNVSAEIEGAGKFGLRFNGVYSETKDFRHNSNGSINYMQVNLAWMPTDKTKIELLVEDGYREKTMGLGTFTTAEVDADGNGLGNGASIPIQATHPDIPWDWNWSTNNVRSLEAAMIRGRVTHEFTQDFFATAYWQFARRVQVDSDGLNASGMGRSAASWDLGWSSRGGNATGWLNPNTPDEELVFHWHHRDWQNRNWGYGVNMVYNLNFEGIENTFTVGANAWSEDFITFKHTLPGGSPNLVRVPVRANIEMPNPIGPPTDMFVDTAGAHQTQDNSNHYYYAAWQMTALDGRLKTNVAVNKTDFKLIQWNSATSLTPDSITEDDETSPLFGLVFDITDEISFFAVRSTSLFPTTLRNDFQEQLPPLVGTSNEFGFKFNLMDGKVGGTVSYYKIEQEGGGVRDPSAENRNKQLWDTMTPEERALNFPGLTRDELTDQTGGLGDFVDGAVTESKGFEADLVFQPTKNWQILLSYANNDIEISEHVNSSLVGTKPYSGPIETQFAAMTKYSITEGQAAGLSFGLGYQYAGEAFQGTVNGVDRYDPSTTYLELFSGYRFKIGDYDASIRLNAKNLTEQGDFVGWKPTGSSRVATERYEVPVERVYSLTFGLHF
ncbi:MAG: TonB-dependent receptor [Opitutales bacterium]|nr:TonB-dependent receptor [Opitutales bacterium]